MVEPLHALASRVSDLAHEVGKIGRPRAERVSSAQEPCASCGEETAAGSIFFYDRLRIPRPGRVDAFLCALCDAGIRASQKPVRGMSAEDLAAFNRNASAAAITWWSHF